MTHGYFGAWPLLLIHVGFVPSEGPNALRITLFRIQTMEV